MYKFYLSCVIIIVLFSCSTGKKALQKGNYFSAVNKAVERLKSDPDNSKALKVLKDGYPLAINWSQEEMDMVLSQNQAFKWEKAVKLMEDVNHLSELIRATPSARKIISQPKSYSTELNMALNKAAEERYFAGESELSKNTLEAGRAAYEHFKQAARYNSNFKDVDRKILEAKKMGTLNVIVEAIIVRSPKYKLSSAFFYDQVFEFLNHNFPEDGFVNFYSPKQAKMAFIEHPDFITRMEFIDFSVGNVTQHEKEEELSKKVQIETKDTTRVHFKTYKAKLKTYTDEVVSRGQLNYKIIDYKTNRVLRDNPLPGSFTWINKYAIFVGDKEALTKEQLELTHRKAAPLPDKQDLFIELTKPIYEQLSTQLKQFFRKYR